jgi:uncharacterized membrane protein
MFVESAIVAPKAVPVQQQMDAIKPQLKPSALDGPRIGAIAHLYRGEIYRSTIWRTRLDNTTNWAVVTLGIALSVTFSSAEASPLPLLLTGVLCIVFLMFEARRYRYFNVWRAPVVGTKFLCPDVTRGRP